MQIITEHFTPPPEAEACLRAITGAKTEDCLLFDIETTGLSPSASFVFLIGCVYRESKDSDFTLRQFLIRHVQEEEELLRSFFALAEQFRILLHFNGQTFDLPFLEKRAQALKLPDLLSGLTSIDLYRRYRPLKQLLGLSHMNQKALEQFLEWKRKDTLSGAEVVSGYWTFSVSGDPGDARPLLLHNRDDLLGLVQVTEFESWKLLTEGKTGPLMSGTGCLIVSGPETARPSQTFSTAYNAAAAAGRPDGPAFCAGSAADNRPVDSVSGNPVGSEERTFVSLCFQTALPLPLSGPWAFRQAAANGEYLLTVQGKAAELRIPVFNGELFYFLPDYKNYCYLPLEHQIIPKSLAAFVSRDCRVPARPQNCCVARKGRFLPQPEVCFSPAFRQSYESKEWYFEYTDTFWSENQAQKRAEYLSLFLKYLLNPAR